MVLYVYNDIVMYYYLKSIIKQLFRLRISFGMILLRVHRTFIHDFLGVTAYEKSRILKYFSVYRV